LTTDDDLHPLAVRDNKGGMKKFLVLACVCSLYFGCASAQNPPAAHAAGSSDGAIVVPQKPALAARARVRVATGLANPRGMHVLADGSMLVSTAGTGDPADPQSGALLHLRDLDHDGDFDDQGERTVLLDKQPSRNLLDLVRRDEVFGMASIAEGEGGVVLASLADFGGPSKVFRLELGGATESATEWGNTHGNINDLSYDARRKVWVAVASTTDEVVDLLPGGRSERVVKFPPLASGQDAVPAGLRYDPNTGDVLVALFSGSPEGEEGGKGVEIVPRSAAIARVHADSHSTTMAVTGLTVPAAVEVDGADVYVAEFCDSFLDPVTKREDMFKSAMHGGFRRFSGRLLRIDRERGEVTVIAEGLDAPTNLTRTADALYVAEGMGTPGREIPGPDGKSVPLTGFIERIPLR
jgi:hypothetical protein